jgi:hypothetical protein
MATKATSGPSEFRKDFGCAVRPENPTSDHICPVRPSSTKCGSTMPATPPSWSPTSVSYGYTDTLTITLSSTYPDWTELQFGSEQVVRIGHRAVCHPPPDGHRTQHGQPGAARGKHPALPIPFRPQPQQSDQRDHQRGAGQRHSGRAFLYQTVACQEMSLP